MAGFNQLHLRPQNNKAYTLKPGQITKLQFSLDGMAGVFGFYLGKIYLNFGKEKNKMLTKMKSNSRAPWALVVFVMAMLMLLPLPALAQDTGADPELTPAIGINWPQFHYDEANTGYTQAKAPDTSDLAWESGNIGAVEHSQPVIAWSKVFVYCGDNIKALNRFNGQVMWTTPVKERVWDSWSSPAYHWGKVFIGSEVCSRRP
ncbi:MAG: hypothetical protein STSR0004_01430 [Peptococcaceae bacterium]